MGRKWWALFAVCLASFMLLVDVTIVQVALPTIQRQLHANLTDLQWVVDAYALTLAATLLSAGTLADRFGRRLVFTIGVGVFSIASLLCAIATSPLTLNLARALQGFGGAAMFATSLALIAQEFDGRQRATAIAAWSATVGGGVAIGPLLGGLLTEGLGWEWIFLVNVPIGAVTVYLAVTRLGESRDPRARGLDVGGLVTFSASLFMLIYALLRGNTEGWSSTPILAALIGGAVEMVCFVLIELRYPRPMFDLSLFRRPAFSGVSIATFAIAAGMFAMFLYITLYLQNDLGYSPLQGGLRMLPTSGLVFLVPLLTRRFAPGVPARVWLGSGLALIGLGLLLMSGVSASSAWTALLAGQIASGVGIGFANPAIASTALGVVPVSRSGMASGISNTFRLSGLAAGIAGLGAIFQHSVTARLHELVPGAGTGIGDALASGGVHAAVTASPPALRSAVAGAARVAFVHGFTTVLIIGAVIAFAGSVCSWLLVRERDFVRAPAPAVQPAET